MTAKTQPNPVDGCPKCGGKLWDNRETKTNPKAPDYKCRDKACDGCIWPLKPGESYAPPEGVAAAPYAPHPTGKQAFTAGPALPYEQETGAPPTPSPTNALNRLDNLLSVYRTCFDEAHSIAAKHFGKDESHEATAAMTATLLIAAKDMGLVR